MNLDCTICGATSEAEIGGVPVCLDCFHDIQEGDYSEVKRRVKNYAKHKQCQKQISNHTLNSIEKVVCKYFGITPKEMREKKRDRNIVLPRQLCHHFSKEMTGTSLAEIGRRFGAKDHATVLHSNKTINNLKETDKVFRAQYEEILNLF